MWSRLGAPPLHYQWYSNSAPIASATSSSYTVANVQNTATYTCCSDKLCQRHASDGNQPDHAHGPAGSHGSLSRSTILANGPLCILASGRKQRPYDL